MRVYRHNRIPRFRRIPWLQQLFGILIILCDSSLHRTIRLLILNRLTFVISPS